MPDYYDDGGAGAGAIIAFVLLVLPFLLILALAGYIITSYFLMKIFDKAGVQGKWRAWVPFYREMVFAKLGDLSPWVMLGAMIATGILSNVPGIGFIFGYLFVVAMALASYRVGLKLGKDWPLVLLYIIPGLGQLIWLAIAAFSNAPWNPRVQPSPWRTSFLRDTTVWQGVPVQPDAGAAPSGPAAHAAGTPGAYPPPPAASHPGAPQQPTTPPPAPQQPPTTQPPAPGAPRP